MTTSEAQGGLDRPVGRPVQVVSGVTLAILGGLFAGLGVLLLLPPLAGGESGEAPLWLSAPIFATGVGSLVVAVRLLRGRGRRQDGGLLSPTLLRLWGIVFLIFPIVAALQRSWVILESITLLAIAAGCFALARRRRRQVSMEAGVAPIEPGA